MCVFCSFCVRMFECGFIYFSLNLSVFSLATISQSDTWSHRMIVVVVLMNKYNVNWYDSYLKGKKPFGMVFYFVAFVDVGGEREWGKKNHALL